MTTDSGHDPRWMDADGAPIDDHDRGLHFDLQTLLSRRRALGLIGLAGLAATAAACGTDNAGSAVTSGS